MLQWITRITSQLHIAFFIEVKPSLLFEKINKLPWYRDTLQQWLQQLPLKPNSAILEIGCATGVVSEYLSASGFHVTAIDISDDMISRAKRANPKTNVNYSVADVFDLPFNLEQFDAIVCASVINIIPNKDKALIEMSRICKPDGSINLLFPEQHFTQSQFSSLIDSLSLSGFSLSALTTWNRAAPKLAKQEIENVAIDTQLVIKNTQYYLNNMLLSITLIK